MENLKFGNLINENENKINIRRKVLIFLSAFALILIGLIFKIILGGVPDRVVPIYGIMAPTGTIKNDSNKVNGLRQNSNEFKYNKKRN